MDHTHSFEAARILFVLALVLSCSFTDIRARRIPNAILFPMLMVALLLSALDGGPAGLLDSVSGLLLGIGMLLPLYAIGRMGAGDLKLLGVVGALLGAYGAVVAGLATMMAGGIFGMAYVGWTAAKPTVAAYARALGARRPGSVVTAACGGSQAQPVRAAEIPYALAIAVGSIAAMSYTGLFGEVII